MKELIEEADGFTQIFEQNCFGPDVDPSHVLTFQVIESTWSTDNGRQVRRIHKAIALETNQTRENEAQNTVYNPKIEKR